MNHNHNDAADGTLTPDSSALSLAVTTAVMFENAQGTVQSDEELRECYAEDLADYPEETTYTAEEFIAAVKKARSAR